MQRRTENDEILSNYFKTKSEKNKPIPFMTQIAKDTKISIATISRFALRKGFYNFAEMRAHFNSSLETKQVDQFSDYGFIDILTKIMAEGKNIFIAPSKGTLVLGYFLRERLKKSKIPVSMRAYNEPRVEEYKKLKDDDFVIIISLSGDSTWYEEYINMGIKNDAVLITSKEPRRKCEAIKKIILKNVKINHHNQTEINRAIRNTFNWLDDTLNSFEFQQQKKK